MAKLVSLVKGPERKQNIKNALGHILPDLRAALRGKRNILLKQNLVGLQPTIANTHVDAVSAVIEFLQENFADFEKMQIPVAEGCGTRIMPGFQLLMCSETAAFMRFRRNLRTLS